MKKIVFLLALSPISLFAQKHTAVAEQVTPTIYKILVDDNVNANVVISPEKGSIMLVDTGFEGSEAVLDSAIKSISKLPIQGIINTHLHSDHVGGNAYFVANRGVKMILSTEFTRSNVEGAGKPNELIDSSTDAYQIFKGGHTAEDLVLVFEDQKVVMVGDYLFADRFPFVDIENGGNVLRYLENQLKIIEAYPDYKVVGGHGRLYTMAELRKLNEDLQETVAIINSMIMSDDALEDIIASKPLKGWAKFDWAFINQDKWIELIYKSVR